jgi:hypothetical protein
MEKWWEQSPAAMVGNLWEQTLKQHLCMPDSWTKDSLWEPSVPCAAKEAPMKHKVPAFFLDKNWDLSREAAQDASAPRESVRPDVKVPSFFLNKKWDLSDPIGAHGARNEMQRPEESVADARQRRLNFCLQPSARFGMVLEETWEPLPGGLLVVSSIDDCSAFAKTAAGGSGVWAGDVIVEVNGRQGAAAELRELLRQEVVANGQRFINLVVRSRPAVFHIDLCREGKQWNKLGIAAAAVESNSKCLLVQGVHSDGLFPAWNAAHGSLRICKKDLITHVNDVSLDAAAMKREIQQSSAQGSKLRFRIATPEGHGIACPEEPLDVQDLPWSDTTVPWDVQVRRLHDNMSEASTECVFSDSSGTRTPEDSCPSGARTPTNVGV